MAKGLSSHASVSQPHIVCSTAELLSRYLTSAIYDFSRYFTTANNDQNTLLNHLQTLFLRKNTYHQLLQSPPAISPHLSSRMTSETRRIAAQIRNKACKYASCSGSQKRSRVSQGVAFGFEVRTKPPREWLMVSCATCIQQEHRGRPEKTSIKFAYRSNVGSTSSQ